jgi:hypothetical protein
MGVENLVKKGDRPSDHPEEVERGKNESRTYRLPKERVKPYFGETLFQF